jgi:dolichyl-phosphate-mannose--protein O-mannosyl transferase
LGAVVAAGFLAVDFLHFVHSRIGMLDVFTGLFGVAAFLFVVYDRDRRRAGPGADGPSGLWGRFRARRWRIAAGAAAGLAAATKWQGLLVLLAVVLLTIAWETHAVRVAGDISRREAFNRALAREGVSIVAGLFLVPLLVYSVTFLGRLDGSFLAWPWSSGSFYRALWDRQFSMYEFHRFLVTPSWAGSPVWSWPLVMRPIPYLLDRLPGNEVRFVFGGGNPIMWWASLAALVFVAVEWLRRRSPLGAEGVIVAGFFLGYLPWFALSYRRSAIFIYYMVPLVPFMCLALAYVAVRLWRAVAGRAAVVALAVVATGLFVVEYPLLTGEPVAASTWHSRMWVYDDCQQRYAAAQLFPQTDDSSDTSPLSDAEVLTFEPWCGL